MSLLPPILYKAPVTERQNLVTRPWSQWLQALDLRVGGPSAPTILELATANAALLARVTTLEAALAGLLAHGGLPTVAAVAAGAGTGAVVSVSGTDRAGVLSLTTAALADHRSNSDVLTVTFASPYAAPPVVIIAPANDAAWSLLYGRFTAHPCSVRLVQSRVTTTTFVLSVGVVSLPRQGDTYQWQYQASA